VRLPACERSSDAACNSASTSERLPACSAAKSAIAYGARRVGSAFETVRWEIKVSKETDLALRTFLGSQGMKKGDLSKFIEPAVRAHVFHRTVQDIKARNADTDPDELQSVIDNTVREVRAERRAKGKADKT